MGGFRLDSLAVIRPSTGTYPGAPIHMLGDPGLLDGRVVGLLSSTHTPPDLILPTLDLVRAESEAETIFASGFQSPLERECLEVLLATRASVVVCPARSIDRMRLPAAWKARVERGEMLVLSTIVVAGARRPTVELGELRTRMIVEHARSIFMPSGRPGSRTYSAAALALERRLTVYCFDHAQNRDLVLRGATPLRECGRTRGCLGDIRDRLEPD